MRASEYHLVICVSLFWVVLVPDWPGSCIVGTSGVVRSIVGGSLSVSSGVAVESVILTSRVAVGDVLSLLIMDDVEIFCSLPVFW